MTLLSNSQIILYFLPKTNIIFPVFSKFQVTQTQNGLTGRIRVEEYLPLVIVQKVSAFISFRDVIRQKRYFPATARCIYHEMRNSIT